jgi:hypothetical protein
MWIGADITDFWRHDGTNLIVAEAGLAGSTQELSSPGPGQMWLLNGVGMSRTYRWTGAAWGNPENIPFGIPRGLFMSGNDGWVMASGGVMGRWNPNTSNWDLYQDRFYAGELFGVGDDLLIKGEGDKLWRRTLGGNLIDLQLPPQASVVVLNASGSGVAARSCR